MNLPDAKTFGEELARLINKATAPQRERIAKLEREVAAVRRELDATQRKLKAVVGPKEGGMISPRTPSEITAWVSDAVRALGATPAQEAAVVAKVAALSQDVVAVQGELLAFLASGRRPS